ncbi:Beta-galactosidase 3, partial [Cucurbita argyrosperma subsp. sororia]
MIGLIRQPKYGHLKELHRAVKMCEKALVSADPIVTSLGSSQQAYVYTSESGGCAAFLSNYDTNSAARVMFNNMHYNLPPWSISVLPDCRNVVFNTAKVGVQTSQLEMLPTNSPMLLWESYNEDELHVEQSIIFCFCPFSVDIGSTESCLHGGELPTLIVQSSGHAVHVFINGRLSGSAFGTRENRRFTYTGKVNFWAGRNTIALLSVAVGLPNVGGHFEKWNTGILGPVALHGLDQGKWDLSWSKWTYKVGLKGEALNLVSPNGISSVEWIEGSLAAQAPQPLTWHKSNFDAPEGAEPLALDMRGMGKGQIWINGLSIGRYWTAYAAGNCDKCNYAGTFRPPKCQQGCGQPTQRWYHVPRAWLKPKDNLLVVFEELGGNPTGISLVKRSVTSVCADVSEFHPTLKNWHIETYGKSEDLHRPKVHLRCSTGYSITSIKFASFGTPLGTCGSYQQGTCHAPMSYDILEKRCVGKQRCAVTISNSNFGQDPCPNVLKRLSVEVVCAPMTTAAEPNWKG